MLSESEITTFLFSDVFLSCILLLSLSMLGFRLLPFDLTSNISNLKNTSLCDFWDKFILGSSRHPQNQTQLNRAISAFHHYAPLSLLELQQMRKSYSKISRKHKRIGYELGYPAKLDRLEETTRINAVLTSAIAKIALEDLSLEADELASPRSEDLREVREAMQHFVRDWSSEGKEEREVVMQPILDVLREVETERRKELKALVPGSGLGRLAWEISQLGFTTHANELSHYMNTCFRFLLSPSSTHTENQHATHPYAHWFSHQRNNDNLFRSVSFPDVLPRRSDTFKHIPGDFFHLGLGSEGEEYDYVVTQFFIDTSHNIISTLEHIYHLLKPNGTWINLGPLLWRSGAQATMELSLEEVLWLARMVGFEFELCGDDDGKSDERKRKRRTIECEYTADREAMMHWIYKAEFWVAVKR